MKINGLTDTNRLDALHPVPAKGTAKGTQTAASAGTSTGAAAAANGGVAGAGLSAAPRAAPGPVTVSVPDVRPFDSARVERIKDAIRNGEFQVDSAMVAHKLLTSVNELVGRAH